MSYSGTLGLVNVFFNYLMPNKITCIDLRDDWQSWLYWFQEKGISEVQWLESDQIRCESVTQLALELQLPMHVVINTIANEAGESTYYRTSLSQEDGLISPDKLQKVWKNIFTKSTEQRHVVTLNEVIDFSIKKQWLVIDSLNGVSLLKDGSIKLESIDLILIRTLSPQIDLTFKGLHKSLEKKGYVLLDQYSTDDSALIRAIFIKDFSQSLISVKADYEGLESHYHDLRDKENDLQVERRDLLQNIITLDQQIVSYVALEEEHKKLIEKLKEKTKKLDKLQARHKSLKISYERLLAADSKIDTLSKSFLLLEENLRVNKEYTDLYNKDIIELLSYQKLALDDLQIFNEKRSITQQFFTKNLANTVAQVESYIALNNYFNTGKKLSNYHGWPISPDIALFLVDRMNQYEYDAVIEFGSGTSTELFAKIAERKAQNHQKVPEILSFDHLDEYYQKTLIMLQQSDLVSYVNLILAPLVPMQLEGVDYQYYDCNGLLQSFLEKLPESPKILVLVDGPPGTTCKYARYPALPMILLNTAITKMQLDIVLDDAYRQEEKEVLEKWEKLLNQYSYKNEKSIPRASEKGLMLLSMQNY